MNAKQLKRHEQNLDAAYREIEMREAMGEDMSRAYVDGTTYAVLKSEKITVYLGDFSEHELKLELNKKTYAVIKSVKTDAYGLRMYTGEFAMQMLCV